MARWFRSEPMEYISLIVNEDAAHDCLADLGNLGVIQFTDVSQVKKRDMIDEGFAPLNRHIYVLLVFIHGNETKLNSHRIVSHRIASHHNS